MRIDTGQFVSESDRQKTAEICDKQKVVGSRPETSEIQNVPNFNSDCLQEPVSKYKITKNPHKFLLKSGVFFSFGHALRTQLYTPWQVRECLFDSPISVRCQRLPSIFWIQKAGRFDTQKQLTPRFFGIVFMNFLSKPTTLNTEHEPSF